MVLILKPGIARRSRPRRGLQ